MDKITNIPIEKVERPKEGQRISIDANKIRELADSIKEKGLLQPILVRRNQEKYEIVAGDRRYLAHGLLGLKKIKGIIRDLDDRECFMIRATENLQSEDLSPIEEGYIYKEMTEKYRLSSRSIATNLGISQSKVIERLKIIEMEDYVTKAIHEGRISARVAMVLGKIEDEGVRKMYLMNGIENGVSIRTAEFWFNQYQKTTLGKELPPGKQRQMEFDEMKKKHYGACDICEEPTESENLKALVICKNCFKIIQSKKGGE